MFNKPMRANLGSSLPLKWRSLIGPVFMVLCLYLLLQLSFSDTPLFTKNEVFFAQGEVPTVRYHPSLRLLGLVLVLIVFNIFFFYALSQWARYYLNRKLVLSYLFFAIIPLMTIILIAAAGIKAWFGISNTLHIENVLDLYSSELENFVESIHVALKGNQLDSDYRDFDKRINEIIQLSKDREMTRRHMQDGAILIEVYYLSAKIPGSPRTLLPITIRGMGEGPPSIPITEEDEAFEAIYPTWLKGDKWTDIVNKEGILYLRHFNATAYLDNNILIVVSIPIDKEFLQNIIEYQAVKITLSDKGGTRYISTDSPQGKWYLKLLLKPLSSKWDIIALNWGSGYYEDYGSLHFELEPMEIGRTLSQEGRIHLFHSDQKGSYYRFIIGMAMFLIFGQIIAAVFGFYLVRYITRSLHLIAYGHEQIAGGQLSYRLPFIGKDQLGSMGRSFNSMVSSIESLMTQVLEKEKYHEELRIARDIQMSLLPNIEDLDWCKNIAATCIPALEVGGDYYEILKVPEGRVGIFIADVSGKGTSAAFYMAELKGVLIALKHLWDQPKELMVRMNEILQPALSANIFISAAYLLLDAAEGKGTLARAGHCPTFHLTRSGEITDLVPPGIAIGLAGTEVFGKIIETAEFSMAADDKVVMYTDGLDEMTFHQEMYGISRLKETLRKNVHLPVEDLKDAILEDVLSFLSSEDQNDDLTLVVAGTPLLQDASGKGQTARRKKQVKEYFV